MISDQSLVLINNAKLYLNITNTILSDEDKYRILDYLADKSSEMRKCNGDILSYITAMNEFKSNNA